MARLELFVFSLLLSVILETGLILVLLRFWPSLNKEAVVNYPKVSLICVGATLISISWLWWIFPLWMGASVLYLPVGELLVTLFEGMMYKVLLSLKWSGALLLSALANGFSFTVGIMLFVLVPGFANLSL
ncbi:MAG: hypothetical protein KBA79_06280 [Candidatus Cloacimonetes bacterium]|nr:hypothetical protein [Candidatus Cloacimonadota bacterium]HOH79324.1 hypothetical protein [Candidatus Cloacimonadota bacterium]